MFKHIDCTLRFNHLQFSRHVNVSFVGAIKFLVREKKVDELILLKVFSIAKHMPVTKISYSLIK